MKIFVTFFVATTLTLANANIGLKQSYSYNSIPQQGYYTQQLQQQYPGQSILPTSFIKINSQYLPHTQQQQQQSQQDYIIPQQHQQQQQQQQKSFAMKFPMPSDFPTMFAFKPAVKTTARRYRPRTRIPKKPIVTKSFFIHSAPEETEDEIEEELAALQQQPRKHYNVLFVKTPSQTNKAAALNLAKAITEEKTVVYVLAKKTSAADLQDAIQQTPQQINKPEVFFIKYRTPEEAANAQRQIQSQYDSLGGSTVISDEGVAPATSVVGSLDASEEEDDDEQQHQQQHQQQQQQQLDNSQEQQQHHHDENQLVNTLEATGSGGYLPPASNQ